LEDLTKTPIVKYLLHQILNKDFDVTKASYKLLLRVSNNGKIKFKIKINSKNFI